MDGQMVDVYMDRMRDRQNKKIDRTTASWMDGWINRMT